MKNLLIILSLFVFISCQGNDPIKFLEKKGYTNIHLYQNDSICCESNSDYTASFKAKNIYGQEEEGCLCGFYLSRLKK